MIPKPKNSSGRAFDVLSQITRSTYVALWLSVNHYQNSRLQQRPSTILHSASLCVCYCFHDSHVVYLWQNPLLYGLFVTGGINLLAVINNNYARYFATFLVVMDSFSAIPLTLSWVFNNSANESQRAVELGMLYSIDQCLAILASFSFPTSEKPFWRQGFGLNLAFVTWFIT